MVSSEAQQQQQQQQRLCLRCGVVVDDGDWTFCLGCVVDMIKKGESPEDLRISLQQTVEVDP